MTRTHYPRSSFLETHSPSVRPPYTLVATKLPEGKVLYTTPGVSSASDRLLRFARVCGDCPEHIEAVLAESVGLEQREEDGTKCPYSDSNLKGKWVTLCNVN